MILSRFSFLLACTFLCGLAAAAEPKTPDLPQWRGQQDGGGDFSTRVFSTQADWAGFWLRSGKPAPQALDEKREMAVLITLGERPTGGFKPRILSATESDGKYLVVYSEGKPGPDTFVTQALTYPWVIAIVPKSSLKVETRLQAP
ncbi:MAG: protease complex subunit PrcB family protein [Verrucomicrobiaceae bacterium]|nr:protease complex subunit PrcB family protein [Verrucomicrobiaceae bacterium]